MCGIAGVITSASPADRAEGKLASKAKAAVRMMQCLVHRGPDDQGLTTVRGKRGEGLLAHTRLSILDLSEAGHQPMRGPKETNWITYNGEIYNYRELRGELDRGGKSWGSQTDTEVLLRAYEKWGKDCLCRLRGASGKWVGSEASQPRRLGLLPRVWLGPGTLDNRSGSAISGAGPFYDCRAGTDGNLDREAFICGRGIFRDTGSRPCRSPSSRSVIARAAGRIRPPPLGQ
ncbi:MAG: hypothetical protein HYV04_14735 [Deltaproteobacteria bacterium]|nr:hypothetical protein [Deltaproteobacteria bacterium]